MSKKIGEIVGCDARKSLLQLPLLGYYHDLSCILSRNPWGNYNGPTVFCICNYDQLSNMIPYPVHIKTPAFYCPQYQMR